VQLIPSKKKQLNQVHFSKFLAGSKKRAENSLIFLSF